MTAPFPDIIILAGGFGTRLQNIVKDVPKPMAPIAGKPFLEWLLNYLSEFGAGRVILSTGYKHKVIEDHFGSIYKNISIHYCIEDDPLGTGGAIKKAMGLVKTDTCLVLNGDTFFKIDHRSFIDFHSSNGNLFSMALKLLATPTRYGTVTIENNLVRHFNEKDPVILEGYINAGVYLMSKDIMNYFPATEKFSFEKDFLEKMSGKLDMGGFINDGYFIDIGIPEDYEKANNEFEQLFN